MYQKKKTYLLLALLHQVKLLLHVRYLLHFFFSWAGLVFPSLISMMVILFLRLNSVDFWWLLQEQQYNEEEIQVVVSYPNKLFVDMKSEPVSDASVPNLDLISNAPVSGDISLMPSSLSQVDTLIFQELPEDLRTDILELLPAHRNTESSLDASLACANNQSSTGPSISSIDLWVGDPPEWIDIFKASNCQILRILAEMYQRAGAKKQLSSVLQRTMSQIYILPDVGTDGWAEAVSCLCELIKQYLKLKISTDIEEVYICSCLLRRYVPETTDAYIRLICSIYVHFLQHISFGTCFCISFPRCYLEFLSCCYCKTCRIQGDAKVRQPRNVAFQVKF